MNGRADGIRVWPVPANTGGALRFEVHGMIEPTAVQAAAVDAMWEELRQENPRLYDGPVLLADRHSVKQGRLLCFRGSYKHLAVSAAAAAMKPAEKTPPPPFLALGVQGVVVGMDADGDEVVLMGRRSSETRIYGGLWENAPSGTVPPPPEGQDFLDWAEIITALRAEGMEELGLNLDASSVSWIALLEDRVAGSMDVVLRVNLGRVDARRLPCPIHEGRWEYVDAAWVPVKRLASWIHGGAAVSPPTAALFANLGWTEKGGGTQNAVSTLA